MVYYIGTYTNGYPQCDEEVLFIAESEAQAIRFMESGLSNYGFEYENCVDDYYEDEEESDYWDNVDYSLREATPEEVEEIGKETFFKVEE